jgi:hypothetical protein
MPCRGLVALWNDSVSPPWAWVLNGPGTSNRLTPVKCYDRSYVPYRIFYNDAGIIVHLINYQRLKEGFLIEPWYRDNLLLT